jgi:para-aminobenzoate synthetase/4-amino-4-deoxychorismate lyase
VAIRTVLVNRATGEAEYGVGGGIVADSNRAGEWHESQIKSVTESTIANLVVESGGALLTPPVSSGLLPGTLRAHLLDEGKIREQVISVQEMIDAPNCYLLNSVRRFHPASIAYSSVISCPSL